MKASSSKTEDTAMASSDGLMVESTKVAGRLGNNTAKASLPAKMARSSKVNGRTERGLVGPNN